MITFRDGPAAGVELRLARVPVLLRVAFNPLRRTDAEAAGWDALDQVDDEAKPHEVLYVYRRCTAVTTMHVSCRPRSASGTYNRAAFTLHNVQPDQATLHDKAAWAAWCDSVRDDVLAQLAADVRDDAIKP